MWRVAGESGDGLSWSGFIVGIRLYRYPTMKSSFVSKTIGGLMLGREFGGTRRALERSTPPGGICECGPEFVQRQTRLILFE